MPRRKKEVKKDEAVMVVDYYLQHNISMRDAAYELGMTLYHFRNSIKAAIEEGWISEEKAEQVKKKSMEHQANRGYNNYRTALYYRKEEIKRDLGGLKKLRMEYYFKVKDFEYYGLDEEQLEDIKKRLRKVEKEIHELEYELDRINGRVKRKK